MESFFLAKKKERIPKDSYSNVDPVSRTLNKKVLKID